MPLTPSTRLGSYQILAPLGAGGMGEVYRARDTRLDRDVAIKVLPAGVAGDPGRLARFEREARAVAGLNHPNIVVLHSVEDVDGTRFLTMELVEGQSLDRHLVPGGMPIAHVVECGIAIADALSAAHEKGIVHRDLKPANVMLTREGRVKVLDFGLAKLDRPEAERDLTQAATVATPLSEAGQVLGTVPYMAPEQIRGQTIDARTDLFALGIVLYEMAAGKRPFSGATFADIHSAILRDTPPPLTRERADLPADLERIVGRCLEKEPRERFQSALDVVRDLRALHRALEQDGTGAVPAKPASVASVAVLPFVNRSAGADDEYFSDGLADELINLLARMRGLRVAARTSAFHFKGKDATIAEVARALNVTTILEGSVRKAGPRVRISVQLVNAADGYPLWSGTYDRTLEDVFAVQDDIARSVVAELHGTLVGGSPDTAARGEGSAAHRPTRAVDPEVYDLYLRGRHQLVRRGFETLHRAIEFFDAALARDPAYALAHLGRAEAHALIGFHEFQAPREAFPRARAAAERALELDSALGEAHAVLGYVALHHDRAWESSERAFLRAIDLNPRHAVTRLWYANLLLAAGRFDEALEQGRRALDLDPLSTVHSLVTGWIRLFEGRLDLARLQLERAVELDPNFFQARLMLGIVLWQTGNGEEARGQLDHAARLAGHPAAVLFISATLAAGEGRREDCLDMVGRMIAMRSERHVSAHSIATGFIAAGELDRAEPWIERAAEERCPWINFMNVDPRMRAMHGRPGIEAIRAGLGKGSPSA